MLPVCVLGIVVLVDTGPPINRGGVTTKINGPHIAAVAEIPVGKATSEKASHDAVDLLGPKRSSGRTKLCHPIVCNYQRTFWHRAVHNGDSLKEYPIVVSDVSLGQSVPL